MNVLTIATVLTITTSLVIAVLTAATTAQAAPNEREFVSGFAVSDTTLASVAIADDFDQMSFVSVQVSDLGVFPPLVYCFGSVPYADLVKVSGSAESAAGSGDAVLEELECQWGQGQVQTVNISCQHDGIQSYVSVGKTTSTFMGNRQTFQGTVRQSSASCTMEIDGVTYEGFGNISSEIRLQR